MREANAATSDENGGNATDHQRHILVSRVKRGPSNGVQDRSTLTTMHFVAKTGWCPLGWLEDILAGVAVLLLLLLATVATATTRSIVAIEGRL